MLTMIPVSLSCSSHKQCLLSVSRQSDSSICWRRPRQQLATDRWVLPRDAIGLRRLNTLSTDTRGTVACLTDSCSSTQAWFMLVHQKCKLIVCWMGSWSGPQRSKMMYSCMRKAKRQKRAELFKNGVLYALDSIYGVSEPFNPAPEVHYKSLLTDLLLWSAVGAQWAGVRTHLTLPERLRCVCCPGL